MDNIFSTNKPQNRKLKPWMISLILIGATLLIGVVGSLIGGKMNDNYIQPPMSPADWVFPVVWTINYIAIGFAAFLTFQSNQVAARRRNDLIWYGVHLFFNLLWPLFFFRLNLLAFSIFWLVLNIVSAIIVTCRFYKSNLLAGIIIIVYIMRKVKISMKYRFANLMYKIKSYLSFLFSKLNNFYYHAEQYLLYMLL